MPFLSVLSVFLLSYLLGSIPFGLVLTRMAGLGDIRKIGSGNIGATNVLRTGNKPLALLTLLLDSGKGAIAVIITHFITPDLVPFAALGALGGHLFPVWLKFKGGKGVATTLGTYFALSWPVGIAMGLTWLGVAKVTRYSSLSALTAIALSPVFLILFQHGKWIWMSLIIIMLVFYKHHENIQRLMHGTENKIGNKANAQDTEAKPD
ncbi:MAG: glycerol-3-phosphate 1-O-acyltransferase PlsY [Alphaproteobacteria bacterium]|nr:glycerol-3-phosphate 1-O-acyltransferase PlsY [Alphaproteobacteria bacterium]MBV8547839.1 glycerol-3-phosphate 1-O-acyltransferase PlsY [Alphaproteobacteria bacterium]